MADSLNTTNLSRRSILGTGFAAAGALSVLGTLPTQAAEADAKLLKLFAAYLESEAKDNEAYAAWDEAQAKGEARIRIAPVLIWPSIIQASGLYAAQPDFDNPVMDRAAIEELVAKFPVDKQDLERERRLRALEEWNAECAAANKAYHVDELEQASKAAARVRDEAWAALMDTPATSMSGVALKLAAVLRNDPTAQMVWTGAKSLSECQAAGMLLSARADALRLAGLPHTLGVDQPQGTYHQESV
jgi:hypothetical protein